MNNVEVVMNNANVYYLPHSTRCFVCGADNDVGLKCRFFTDDGGMVHLKPLLKPHYAGFLNVVHGGVQTAMMDEAMGWCCFTQSESDQLFFTREITVKFRKNFVPMTPVSLEARLLRIKRGMAYTEGTIRDETGAVLTSATGVFVPIPLEKMAETKNHLLFINDGRVYHKRALEVCNPSPSDK